MARLVTLVSLVLVSFGCGEGMGTPVKISATETVHYSGKATETEAKALGEMLREVGFFGLGRQVDVLLKKDEEGTVVSFVVSAEGWTKPEHENNFRLIGASIAPSVGGKPIKIRLIDDKLNTQKEIAIGVDSDTRLKVGEKEAILYSGSATEAEARALGEVLRKEGYFDGTRPVDVLLKKGPGPGGATVSFVGRADLWSSPEAHAEFQALGEALAPSVGGKPLKIHLLDESLILLKELEIK